MTAIFAIPLVIGIIGLLAWIGLTAAASMVPAWDGLDPEARFGQRGRVIVGAVFGFGMGGMSTLYTGAAAWLAVIGGLADAAALGYAVGAFGPSMGSGGPEDS